MEGAGCLVQLHNRLQYFTQIDLVMLPQVPNCVKILRSDTPPAIALQVPLLTSSAAKVTVGSKWAVPTANYVKTFAAVAYLLGLNLQQATKLHIGIVQSSYGEWTAVIDRSSSSRLPCCLLQQRARVWEQQSPICNQDNGKPSTCADEVVTLSGMVNAAAVTKPNDPICTEAVTAAGGTSITQWRSKRRWGTQWIRT